MGEQIEYKVFNDPIHGHIELHPLFIKIIDTPQFQRLRYLKQLGGCYFVFPGASHNRFEHSLGVCYLAGELLSVLRRKQPELEITIEDILCVQIAGLCHDLGHGPFSHMFDNGFIPKVCPGTEWKHEEGSVNMFKHLVNSNNLSEEFKKYNLGETDMKFVTELIAGPRKLSEAWSYEGRPEEKSYLYEIVANKRTGIDVDKWDYFARDCHHLGIQNSFDHNRFMKFARVLDVGGQKQICSRDKEVDNLYEMFHTRVNLHKRAYRHKTADIIEDMITESLVKANDHLKFKGKKGAMLKMSEAINDPEAYTRLNDSVYHLILLSTADELAEAREILERIEKRDLYRCVGQTKPDKKDHYDKSENEKMKKDISGCLTDEELELREDESRLVADDLLVHIVQFDYGMKKKNPLEFARFYSKGNPKQAIEIRRDEVSHMLPDQFFEQHIRVFSKKTDSRSLEIAEKCFKKWCEDKGYKPKDGSLHSTAYTPVKNQVVDPPRGDVIPTAIQL